jgi:UDP-2-acetamido-2,6-beta-L-arabino-hexul-4-ose reductase
VKIGLTGQDGFLAWHVRCALWAHHEVDVVGIGRAEFESATLMDDALVDVNSVIHLAGVNRGTDEDVASINPELAQRLAAGIQRAGRPITVSYGNSIQADGDSIFGEAKAAAAGILRSACAASGSSFVNVMIPNVFGEHGRPFYNSVVATFSHQIAIGETPHIDVDRELTLVHAQTVAAILLEAAFNPVAPEVRIDGKLLSVSELLDRLIEMSGPYVNGQLPDLGDPFTRDLFNTFRSFTFPSQWPIYPVKHADDRGELVEAVRASGGETQVFFSSTNPGFTRGNHFHLRKVERFLVLQGQASIRLRRLFTSEIVEFEVSGDKPAIIDMPTLWTHSITNTGDTDLLTLFYADDEYNPDDPDTYWIAV